VGVQLSETLGEKRERLLPPKKKKKGPSKERKKRSTAKNGYDQDYQSERRDKAGGEKLRNEKDQGRKTREKRRGKMVSIGEFTYG